MERRQLLKCLLAGGVSAAIPTPSLAQQEASRSDSGAPRVAAGEGAARPDGTQTLLTTPEELEPILREWEEKTAIIKRLRGSHQRYEYDEVFGIEKRAIGEFWFEAPDKGRIDFQPAPLPDPPINQGKKTARGEFYRIQAEEPLTWNCDGKSILQVEHTAKTYGMAEIPPQNQGENIMDSPLPFLFGMKADKIRERYRLSLGEKHDKTGNDGRKKYHIVASPLLESDARNWQRAEVLLDAQYCLPGAIRLIDPAGTKETVYVFPLSEMKANEKVWFPDPFKLSLRGYKLVERQDVQIPNDDQKQGILRVRGVNTQPVDRPQPGRSAQAVPPVSGGAQPLGRAQLRDFGNKEQ
jgi:TIGR03009 family protein